MTKVSGGNLAVHEWLLALALVDHLFSRNGDNSDDGSDDDNALERVQVLNRPFPGSERESMPTVPSTCVPVDNSASVVGVPPLSEANIHGSVERTVGPTPDPDTDDVVLVPVEQGNAVSLGFLESAPPQSSVKPRIDLSNLNLHSPSSIVGTPFDISPRFEYPFPPATCSPLFPSVHDFDPGASSFAALPAVDMTNIPSIPSPMPGSFPSFPVATVLPGRARGETRNFSPTHPKLQSRDPPVPPGLVKKHKLNKVAAAGAAPARLSASRPRAGSLSRVMHMQDRGRLDGPIYHRPTVERQRSQSLDVSRRRAPLLRHPSDVTVVDQDVVLLSTKPPLSHASSSRTLLLDSDVEEKDVDDSPQPPAESPLPSTDEPGTVTFSPGPFFAQDALRR
ncbi:hypothetical protein BD413DRAFT_616372 [Trametes elegans]|nr:hypothetical protein BD413DRAFT_616372 [Trametes elegans]